MGPAALERKYRDEGRVRCSRLGWVECRRLEGSRYKWVSQISENRQDGATRYKASVYHRQGILFTVEVGSGNSDRFQWIIKWQCDCTSELTYG